MRVIVCDPHVTVGEVGTPFKISIATSALAFAVGTRVPDGTVTDVAVPTQ
jgi:hypothetical protein